jgi:hypothetical protein
MHQIFQDAQKPFNSIKRGDLYIMGLLLGEGTLLRQKYMKVQGLTFQEATQKVSDLVDQLERTKYLMRLKKKSEIEIKQKEQEFFEKEFQKLASYE